MDAGEKKSVSDEPDSAAARAPTDLVTIEAAGAETVQALIRALELHNYGPSLFAETAAHIVRVTKVALELAERVAPELAADPRLAYGFRLHDIGMIGVSNAILRKRCALTNDELAEVREHPLLGERIVAPLAYLGGIARQVIGGHHEKWDGSGYPRQLSGTQTPLAARIFAVADAWDAMTSDQPYRQALPTDVALDEIRQNAGTHFDPALVPVFLDVVEEDLAVAP